MVAKYLYIIPQGHIIYDFIKEHCIFTTTTKNNGDLVSLYELLDLEIGMKCNKENEAVIF